MRIIFRDEKHGSSVYEVVEVINQIGWHKGLDSEVDPPSDFWVTMETNYSELHKELKPEDDWPLSLDGQYELDGTKESFDKALKNYNEVCEKLLTQGWCASDDFENFEWF